MEDITVRRRVAPAAACNSEMQMHTANVSAVAFFKNGRRIVTTSLDETLRIWDVEKRALVGGPFVGHSGCVNSVAVSPDDRRIASGGEDRAIIIWDVDSKQKVFKPLLKHTNWVRSVCFSSDGKKLASGSWDTTVIGYLGVVDCVAFSPDGLKIAFGARRKIRVCRTENAERLFDIAAHQNSVESVVWSPDGQQLVAVSHGEKIKFWDSSNGTQIGQSCTGHTSLIKSLAISSDGSFIATASNDQTIRLWSTKSYQQIGQIFEHTSRVSCVAISPNGELLVSGDIGGNVQLWSIKNTISAAFGTDSAKNSMSAAFVMDSSYFVYRSKVKLGKKLYAEALSDAEKVIELDPSYYIGYELKHAALHGAQHYDHAFEAFKIMLSKLDNAPDPEIRQLRQQYVSPSEVEDAIRRAIDTQLKNAPLRLINTYTGRLCNRDAQNDAFIGSTQYKELLYSSVIHAPLKTELIREAVEKYFGWVMLSHRWERKEPLLHDIRGKNIYDLDPAGTIVKLQKFCKVACDAGHRWAWSDTCCIDQNNNVELGESVNSMFIWYRYSALTIVYLSDVPPSSESGALANSIWNTRGWTVQEFLAPKIVLFYQADWTLYLDDRSCNHKESDSILEELKHSTGINTQALIDFRPGTRDVLEKLRWASNRDTTREQDIAYSLFGIFGIHLPVIYGEKRQNALGRLLQYIIAQSGDVTALDWVGQSSDFNSCLPADISSYKALPYTLSSLSEHEMQISVSALRNNMVNLSVPRFADTRLQLPCIVFLLTEVRQRHGEDGVRRFTYDVKADGLQDLLITTEDKLVQFSPKRRARRKFLLVRPWNRYDLGLINFADETQSVADWPESESPSDDALDTDYPGYNELELIVRLGQPFRALLLAQLLGEDITAQVRDTTSIDNMRDIRMLDIL
ncbi:WD40-repeat-containing domain protein [Suillus spraguei]|nr:WD40-repeat-containing domain protein [Suillus spraguei]